MVRIPDNFQSQLPNVGAPTGPGQIDISTEANRALRNAGEQIRKLGDSLFQQKMTEQASKLEVEGQQKLEQIQNDAVQNQDFRDAPDEFRNRARQTVSDIVNRANPAIRSEIRSRLAGQAATMTNQLRERSIQKSRDATEAAVNNQLQQLTKQFAQTDRPSARQEIRRQINETTKRLGAAGLTKPEIDEQRSKVVATADAARVQQLLNRDDPQAASEFLNQSENISVDQTRILKNRIDARRRERNQRLERGFKVIETHVVQTGGQLPKTNIPGFDSLEEFRDAAEGTEIGRQFRGLLNNAEFMQNHGSKPHPEQKQQLRRLRQQAQDDPRARRRLELAQQVTQRQLDAIRSDDPYGQAAQHGLVSEQPDLPFQAALQGDEGQKQLADALVDRIEAQRSLTEHLTGQKPDDAQIGGQVDLLKKSEREQLTSVLNSQSAPAAASILQQMSETLGPDDARKLAGSLAKKNNIVGFAAQVAGEDRGLAEEILRGRAASDVKVKIPGDADTEFTNTAGRSISADARRRIRPAVDAIYKTRVLDQNLDPDEFHSGVFQSAVNLAIGGKLNSSGEVTGGPVEVGGRKTLPPRRGMSENETRDAFEALTQERNASVFARHAGGLPARMNPTTGEFEQLSPADLEDAQPRHVGGGRYTLRLGQDGGAVHAVDPQTGEPRGELVINMRSALESGDLNTSTPAGDVNVNVPFIGEFDLPLGSTGAADEFEQEGEDQGGVQRQGPGLGRQSGNTVTPENTGPPTRAGFGGIFSDAINRVAEFFTDEGGNNGSVTVELPSRSPVGAQPQQLQGRQPGFANAQNFQDRSVPKPGDDNSRPPIPPTKTKEIQRAIQGQAADIRVDEDGGVQVPDDVLRTVDVQSEGDLPRGVRNNNPMNVKDFGIAWKGAVDQSQDETFEQFKSPAFGIRAGVRDILNDHIRDGKRTLRGLFGEFAPESENPTSAYVNFVADRVGVSPSAEVDLTKPAVLQDVVRASIEFENGIQPYSDRVISSGIALALESQPGVDN